MSRVSSRVLAFLHPSTPNMDVSACCIKLCETGCMLMKPLPVCPHCEGPTCDEQCTTRDNWIHLQIGRKHKASTQMVRGEFGDAMRAWAVYCNADAVRDNITRKNLGLSQSSKRNHIADRVVYELLGGDDTLSNDGVSYPSLWGNVLLVGVDTITGDIKPLHRDIKDEVCLLHQWTVGDSSPDACSDVPAPKRSKLAT